MRLEPVRCRAALVAGGFAVMTYDPRHVGESGGEPRHLVDVDRLIDDATAAMRALRSDPGTAEFVALLSFSFGGGSRSRWPPPTRASPPSPTSSGMSHQKGDLPRNSLGSSTWPGPTSTPNAPAQRP